MYLRVYNMKKIVYEKKVKTISILEKKIKTFNY